MGVLFPVEKPWLMPIFLAMGVAVMAAEKQYCPKICVCDIYEEMRRADCSGQNLVSTYTDVPDSVEILYLSRNKISILDDEELSEYTKIVILDLSKNDIHTIYLNAFEKMQRLHRIDLSSNRLEQLDNRIFELNSGLQEIDLSRNKFMTISDSPLLISGSLEVLFLAESHMSHLFASNFERLPKLKMLDISENLLKTLQLTYFNSQQQLELLNLKMNPWACDDNMRRLMTFYEKKKVTVLMDTCLKKTTSHKFEKILMGTAPISPLEDIDIDLVWTNVITNQTVAADFRLPFEECDLENTAQNCDLLKICQSNYAKLFEKYLAELAKAKSGLVHVEKPVKCYGLTLGFLLFAGFFLGAISGVSVVCLASMCRFHKKFGRKKAERRQYQEAMRSRNLYVQSRLESPLMSLRHQQQAAPTTTLVSRQETTTHNTPQVTRTPAPVAVRQRDPPSRSNSQRRQIEVPNATQLLMRRLFTRPTRQPKPRVTTVAVRRLSDSSLESPPMLRRNDNSDVFTSDCLDTLERSLIGRPTSNSIDSLQRLRTESPPPPYDFVTNAGPSIAEDFANSVIASSCVTSDQTAKNF